MRGDSGERLVAYDRSAEKRRPVSPTFAAVDLGTHNCRMLMARPDRASGFRVIRSFSKPVRLGEGLDANGSLSEAAMERAVAALGACANRIDRFSAVRVRSIATEACRRAENAADFLSRVESETGLVLEPVTAADEARLTLAGCRPLFDARFPHVLLFDIGGGSTEVTWVEQVANGPPVILAMLSLPIGVVSFSERYGGDVVSPPVYSSMVASVRRRLQPFEAECRIRRELESGRVQMIGTSGTVTTLAATLMRLKRYDRARVDGQQVSFKDLAEVSADMAASSWRDRASNPCIGPDRADLVVAGCAIFDAVCRTWPVGRLSVADRGIREGLLMSMISEAAHTAPVRAARRR